MTTISPPPIVSAGDVLQTPFAIIDIGSSAIRMVIAELHPDGSIRVLESLHQEVALGRETFSTGRIERATIEDCVSTVKSFRRVLQEYRITQDAHIRAVATNAVREATNRDAILDRIYSATGITVDVIEEAEVSRYTYMSVQPLIDRDAALSEANLLIIEVSGGSTEVLFLQQRKLMYAMPYRLGSFRLRETLGRQGAAKLKLPEVMKGQISRTVDQISKSFRGREGVKILALGGDIRFAAKHLLPEWKRDTIGTLPVDELTAFTQKILKLSVDEIVRRYHLDYADAETVSPALLTYTTLAAALKIRMVHIAASTMREGVVREMAAGNVWPLEFQEQIIHSAIEIGKKYAFDQAHAEHVAMLSRKLFRGLQQEHLLASRYELILRIAAILHDIGSFISNRSHHKHSMYLIYNSDLFGMGSRDLQMAALVARYHRRAAPNPTHEEFSVLDRESRIVVTKLAALLRVADALDRNYTQHIRDFDILTEEAAIVIVVKNVLDLTLESMAMREKGALFGQIFGKDPVLRAASSQEITNVDA
jgi:exopolyphosphatase/guanosine-5'-triphosphate,3'-diphosphate pyrophosphatase